MNRFHVHVHVTDLQASIRFYSQLFGAEPSVLKFDYAKWMVEDPRVNFAISTVAGREGIAHLGLQTETGEELAAIGARLAAADEIALAEKDTTCCYARSDKFWATDPQGLRWETFRSFGEAATYYAPPQEADVTGAATAAAGAATAAAGAATAGARIATAAAAAEAIGAARTASACGEGHCCAVPSA